MCEDMKRVVFMQLIMIGWSSFVFIYLFGFPLDLLFGADL